jgi:hypothetical protein
MQVQLLEYVEDLATMLGVRPNIWRHLGVAPRWFFGPFSATHYRLDEPARRSKNRAFTLLHEGERSHEFHDDR